MTEIILIREIVNNIRSYTPHKETWSEKIYADFWDEYAGGVGWINNEISMYDEIAEEIYKPINPSINSVKKYEDYLLKNYSQKSLQNILNFTMVGGTGNPNILSWIRKRGSTSFSPEFKKSVRSVFIKY